MNNENNPKNNRLSLDLSLGILSQEEDEVEAQDPVEEQGQFIQLLESASVPPENNHSPLGGHYNALTATFNVAAPSPYPQLPQPVQSEAVEARTEPRLGRPPAGHQARRNASRGVDRNLNGEEIVPPFPWATTRPAMIHSLSYLSSKNINVISGQVHCRACDKTITLEYNLKEKFLELTRYIEKNKGEMRHRAPNIWMNPRITPCGSCESEMKPVISDDIEGINWLFLLLGQMLGCCTLVQLRYFCDRTSQHRTGAKDRVLYLTYLGLCKQLEPINKLFFM